MNSKKEILIQIKQLAAKVEVRRNFEGLELIRSQKGAKVFYRVTDIGDDMFEATQFKQRGSNEYFINSCFYDIELIKIIDGSIFKDVGI